MEIFTVAFFGHRYIEDFFKIDDYLYEVIKQVIDEHEYVDFLVGGMGDFDHFASSAVKTVRQLPCMGASVYDG